jgi:hypothetical protein
MARRCGPAFGMVAARSRPDMRYRRSPTRRGFPAHGPSLFPDQGGAALIHEPIVGSASMPAKAGVTHHVRHTAVELSEYRIRVKATRDMKAPCRRMAEQYQIEPPALAAKS